MLETRKGGRPSRRPDKETLQHLSDMLTIEQIAQLYCVDRSTVCNWKKYYRLPPSWVYFYRQKNEKKGV